jgi:hypothetical protein
MIDNHQSMSKNILLFFLFLLPTCLLTGQNASFYTSLIPDIGYTFDLKKTLDQKLIGLIRGTGSKTDYLVKLDTSGNILWQRELSFFYDQCPVFLTQTSDSCYVIICRGNFSGSQFNLLIRTDPEGNLLWSKSYNPNITNNFWDIAPTVNGGFAIIGDGCSGQNYVISFDAAGDILWKYQYCNDNHIRTYAQRLLPCDEGKLLVAGYQYDSVPNNQYLSLYTLDTAGNSIWHEIYSMSGFFTPTCVIHTLDNGYTVTGNSSANLLGHNASFLMHVDANGNFLWAKKFEYPMQTYAYAVVQLEDSSYVLSGTIEDTSDLNSQIFQFKTSVNGNLIWGQSGGRFLGNEIGDDQVYCSLWICGNYFYNGGWADGAIIVKSDGNGTGLCLHHPEVFSEVPITATQFGGDFSMSDLVFFSDTLSVLISPSFLIPEILCTAGTQEQPFQESAIIQPNPFCIEALIQFNRPLENASLRLYNVRGQLLRQTDGIYGKKYTLQRGSLPAGLYLLKITDDKSPGTTLRIEIVD